LKRIIFLAVGLLISVVSLYLALRNFDWGQLWSGVGNIQIGFFLLMIVPYILTFMTKVWRWRVLFHPDEARMSQGLLFSSLMISYVPLPFRLGEVARAVVASSRSGLPVARVFSTILVEKVLDVLTLFLLLGISLPFVGLPEELQGSATVLGVAFLILALGIAALVIYPDLARKMVALVSHRLPGGLGARVEDATEHALQGLSPLANPRVALKLALWSLATWSVNAVTVYLLLLSFNLVVSPMAAVTLVVASNLGMAIPSAPGYIGTFELVVVLVLRVLGIAEGDAQAFALFYHFIGLVPVATIGVIAFMQQGVGMAALRSSPPETAAATAAAGQASVGQPGTRDKG
jgi:glycosyltransferase 2 family protein